MDVVINYKNWVWVASTPFPGLFLFRGGRPTQEVKSPGNEVGVACGLCVNKMADATLSSEDEEIENPTETVVSRGASLVEPEKASISRKRKVVVNSGQYKASREHRFKSRLPNLL